MISTHQEIESLAGAIALGEATDDERRQYREHISTCARCLEELGGEREIERTAQTVADARDSEVWQPDLQNIIERRMQRRRRFMRFGVSALGICLGISFGVHALVVLGIAHLTPTLADPLVINAGGTRIVLEQSAPTPKPAPPPRKLVVEHNVVQMARAPVAAPAPPAPAPVHKTAPKPEQIAAVTVHPDPYSGADAGNSKVPIWRRDGSSWRTVSKTTTTSLTETAPQTMTHSAESIQIASAYTTRDAAPVGGETAITPQPPMIAYDEGASGTTVFEVQIDERGNPTKCTITKSSGYPVLDDAVCNAAKSARYTPKTVGGRAVQGVYRDAFTFRAVNDTTTSEELPKQIQ